MYEAFLLKGFSGGKLDPSAYNNDNKAECSIENKLIIEVGQFLGVPLNRMHGF